MANKAGSPPQALFPFHLVAYFVSRIVSGRCLTTIPRIQLWILFKSIHNVQSSKKYNYGPKVSYNELSTVKPRYSVFQGTGKGFVLYGGFQLLPINK